MPDWTYGLESIIYFNYVPWYTPTFLRLTFGKNQFQPEKITYRLGFKSIYCIYFSCWWCFGPPSIMIKKTINYHYWIFLLDYYKTYAYNHYHGPHKIMSDCKKGMDRIFTILNGIDLDSERKPSTYEKVWFCMFSVEMTLHDYW